MHYAIIKIVSEIFSYLDSNRTLPLHNNMPFCLNFWKNIIGIYFMAKCTTIWSTIDSKTVIKVDKSYTGPSWHDLPIWSFHWWSATSNCHSLSPHPTWPSMNSAAAGVLQEELPTPLHPSSNPGSLNFPFTTQLFIFFLL